MLENPTVKLVFYLRTGDKGSINVPLSVAQGAIKLHLDWLGNRGRQLETFQVTIGDGQVERIILSADVSTIALLMIEDVRDGQEADSGRS